MLGCSLIICSWTHFLINEPDHIYHSPLAGASTNKNKKDPLILKSLQMFKKLFATFTDYSQALYTQKTIITFPECFGLCYRKKRSEKKLQQLFSSTFQIKKLLHFVWFNDSSALNELVKFQEVAQFQGHNVVWSWSCSQWRCEAKRRQAPTIKVSPFLIFKFVYKNWKWKIISCA